jgi:hypothetical protein
MVNNIVIFYKINHFFAIINFSNLFIRKLLFYNPEPGKFKK